MRGQGKATPVAISMGSEDLRTMDYGALAHVLIGRLCEHHPMNFEKLGSSHGELIGMRASLNQFQEHFIFAEVHRREAQQVFPSSSSIISEGAERSCMHVMPAPSLVRQTRVSKNIQALSNPFRRTHATTGMVRSHDFPCLTHLHLPYILKPRTALFITAKRVRQQSRRRIVHAACIISSHPWDRLLNRFLGPYLSSSTQAPRGEEAFDGHHCPGPREARGLTLVLVV